MAELGSGDGTGFPTSIDTDSSTESTSTIARADVPNDLGAAIVALETYLGVKTGTRWPINVKAYGAKGDGSTDDTTVIQNAINAAQNAVPYAIVFFPPGLYKITSALSITDDPVILLGSGSFRGLGNESTDWYGARIYQATTAANAIEIESTSGSLSGVQIYNLHVKGNSGTGKGIALLGRDAGGPAITNCTLQNVTISDFSGTNGIGLYLRSNVFENNFFNVNSYSNYYATKAEDAGGYNGTPSQNQFYSCIFSGRATYKYGFYNDNAGSTWGFHGCVFTGCEQGDSSGLGYYNDGTGSLIECNIENNDIGAQLKGKHIVIGGSASSCNVSGFKLSTANCALYKPAFANNSADDITIDSGSNRTILDLQTSPGSLTITDSANGTVYPGLLTIQSDGSIGKDNYEIPRTHTKRLRMDTQTVTSSSNAVAIDLASGAYVVHTLSENTTIGLPSNALVGDILILEIKQPNGGSYTCALNAGYKTAAGYSAPASNKIDQLTFIKRASTTWRSIGCELGMS